MSRVYQPFAFETLTIGSGNVATSLSSTVYDIRGNLPAEMAYISVGTGPLISYSLTTTLTVSSQTGHQMTPFGSIKLEGHQVIKDFRSTSVSSGTTATIKVTYYR